jgi:nucleoside diphosphate kinase
LPLCCLSPDIGRDQAFNVVGSITARIGNKGLSLVFVDLIQLDEIRIIGKGF